ncbi:DUF6268 family outer membrane beta-barrel protein [Shewanella sp. NIFS-20-20]|uniref:DUF6268 family outer membrane beta-barrel protein n=1 Tax=Shewanella sp. NIFS-20-20 TaxID=2853806 RepID=UPI001C46FFE4|nr:DUF6268 family outer membrane beta-barrel protein [Shewanella sp. NIFS-20-20]MBV7316400.1 autotransporter outer membrane beta-barrel domain-containing protein [Shewanella sp. NIFS-20-20]
MKLCPPWLGLATVPLISTSLAMPAIAAGAPEYSPFKLTVSSVTTQKASVGEDSLKRGTYQFAFNAGMPLSKQWSIGASVGYDSLDYRWQTPDSDPRVLANSVESFSSINRYKLGFSLMYRMDQHWLFMLAPKIQYTAANTASLSDARSYGVVASAMHRFDSGNMLGVGFAYLNDIDEVRSIPYLAIRWQLADNWTLANPFEAGFSGPAGLELTYQASPEWQLGLGSSRRSQRILLADVDQQTVEIEEWVSFLRAGWQISKQVRINGYLGYFFSGEMEVNQPAVNLDIDNQGAGALSFEVKF